jgi:hypothetical protein
MLRIVFKNYLLLIILLISCTPKPVIPISNTLEIGLNNRYSNYVRLLNKSVKGDTVALTEFLIINNIYDAAAYDHGWVLIELMKKLGDKTFSNALSKMNRMQINNLNTYFRGGLDSNNEANKLPKQYPISFKLLGFT